MDKICIYVSIELFLLKLKIIIIIVALYIMFLAYGNMNSSCTIALLCYYIFLQLTTKPRPTYNFRHCTNRCIRDIKLFFSVISRGILQQTKGLYKVCSIDFLRQRGYFTKRSITGIFQFAEMKT